VRRAPMSSAWRPVVPRRSRWRWTTPRSSSGWCW
jgi:hypothetical protein